LMTEYDQASHSSSPYIVDLAGKRIRDIPIRSTPINLFIAWLDTELQFIAITNDHSGNWLYYVDGNTGKIIDKIPLNPRELVPLGKEEYQEIPKNKNRNQMLASESHAYGEMLNEWQYIRYDARNHILALSYYCPAGEIFIDDMNEPSTRIIDYEIRYKIEYSV
ncbi:MAG: hypothetical protein ACTSP4_13280, partial [Candidatus Hodarchaeales archaeon]